MRRSPLAFTTTTLVPTTYNGIILDQGGAIYNINAYTGTTLSARFAAAVADAQANGPLNQGVIYFPPGVYDVDAALVLEGKHNLTILGGGPNVTFLYQNAANSDGIFILRNDSGGTPCSFITIEGFGMGRTVEPTSYTAGGVGIGIASTNTAQPAYAMNVRNIAMLNVAVPVLLDNVHQSSFDNIRAGGNFLGSVTGDLFTFTACVSIRARNLNAQIPIGFSRYPGRGIYLNGDCDTVIVEDCEMSFMMMPCVVLDGGTTGPRLIRLNNVYAESGSGSGFVIGNGRDIRLSGCHAAGNGEVGFGITGGTSVTLLNCLALENGRHGFYVSGGTSVAIQSCTASNNDASSGGYSGCFISNGSGGVRVTGNRFGDIVFTPSSQNYGLFVDTGVTNVIATSNDLQGNATALVIPSTGNVSANNLP